MLTVQERLHTKDTGFRNVWYGGLLGYQTVSTGSFDAPAL